MPAVSSLQNKKATLVVAFLFYKLGARHPKLVEHLILHKMHIIQWKRPQIDLSELAKLRWIENWPRERLAKHFGKTENAIQCHFQELKRGLIQQIDLKPQERKQILWALKK